MNHKSYIKHLNALPIKYLVNELLERQDLLSRANAGCMDTDVINEAENLVNVTKKKLLDYLK